MSEWAEAATLTYTGKPIDLHLRTGYERTVIFPEPIKLYAVNNRLISAQFEGNLPGCDVNIDDKVMGFSPLQRMQPQTVAVLGKNTGSIYELLVSSSPVGSRQPIDVRR